MQRRLDPKTGVNKPFEKVFLSGRIQNFFQGRAPIFVTSSVDLHLILNNLSSKNDSRRGYGSMFLRKIFKNLHTAMAILMLFEQF